MNKEDKITPNFTTKEEYDKERVYDNEMYDDSPTNGVAMNENGELMDDSNVWTDREDLE